MNANRILTPLVGMAILVGLVACSSAPSIPAPPQEDDVAEAPVETSDPEPATPTVSWRSACMLSVDEVTSVMSAYWAQTDPPEPLNGDESSLECSYDESGADAYAGIGIGIRPYGTADTYGWVTDTQAEPYVPWTAPDRATGIASACAAASWQYLGLTGICGEVNGVPYVISPHRLSAVLFPDDGYFYTIGVNGIGGNDHLTAPLQQIITLLSTRGLAD